MGILATLLSMSHLGKTVGIMITASHNPEKDNGMKLVEPNGEMLQASWESTANLLANSDSLNSTILEIINEKAINTSIKARVALGYDTRSSSTRLAACCLDGLAMATVFNFKLVTTPQLHYFVFKLNDSSVSDDSVNEQMYFDQLASAYTVLNKASTEITVDCANGVGAMKMKKLASMLNIKFNLVNTGDGELNKGCGADYVKIQQQAPANCVPVEGMKYASLDGDADRIVYFYFNQGKFKLLDGDKIALLFVEYLKEIAPNANIGVVQTAYANGNSTAELKKLAKVVITQTGVKHLHHAALAFDIGVYFEANGHGTVVFDPNYLKTANEKVLAFSRLINPLVGDAIADLLAVETVLHHFNLSAKDWDAKYFDLPNKQVKVVVKDRSMFKCTNADQQLLEPVFMQPLIDNEVAKYKFGRCFVRPSGTEDIVRVYAEAETVEETNKLAKSVAMLVYEKCDGLELPV